MSTLEQEIGPEAVRADWLAAVQQLLGDITRWSGEQGWSVRTEEKEIREKTLGTYSAPVLNIDTHSGHHGRLIVEPVGYSVPGVRGAVDLFAWSSRAGVELQRREGGWVVHT